MDNSNPPATIEELLGFNPPESVPLPDNVTLPFINKVKGRTFGGESAIFISRYGISNYIDHPLQWLKFSDDGKRLYSYCPGPDGSDASVAGPFRLKEIDSENNYVIELLYGCRTTFVLKRIAIDGEEGAAAGSSSPSRPSETNSTTAISEFLPMIITCQRRGCPQRHRTRFLTGFNDFDELSGERTIGDPGVVQLKRCSQCRQVHYCSIACQRADWRERHRIECNNYGKIPPPNVNVASSNDPSELKAVLMHIFKSCITGGEERDFGPEGTDRAKEVGQRLYALGGKNLCISVCEELRADLAFDEKRRGDARALEFVWCNPVVPGWWP